MAASHGGEREGGRERRELEIKKKKKRKARQGKSELGRDGGREEGREEEVVHGKPNEAPEVPVFFECAQ